MLLEPSPGLGQRVRLEECSILGDSHCGGDAMEDSGTHRRQRGPVTHPQPRGPRHAGRPSGTREAGSAKRPAADCVTIAGLHRPTRPDSVPAHQLRLRHLHARSSPTIATALDACDLWGGMSCRIRETS
ncbi:hypothetical protein C8Q77DRAFT_257749 [Trametes polyzona]|nr:hypothetical protein C8Q77DRAFT_257749 [Trametes polyzona]